jgi:oligopeptidase B
MKAIRSLFRFFSRTVPSASPTKVPMPHPLNPPIADQKPHSATRHGITTHDPYHWLKDPRYPKVKDKKILAYLAAENTYFEGQMAPHAALVETLFQEMKGRMKEDESSVPQKDGDYLYWRRFEKGAQYRQWMRKRIGSNTEEVMLDEAKMAEGLAYFRLGPMAISEDDRILAYGTDTDGSERFTIRFRDLTTGADLADTIPGTLLSFPRTALACSTVWSMTIGALKR